MGLDGSDNATEVNATNANATNATATATEDTPEEADEWRCAEGACCLHVIDLRWDEAHTFSLFQEAVLVPQRNVHVWGALAAVVITIVAATYAGFAYEHQRRSVRSAALQQADDTVLISMQPIFIFAWLVARASACVLTFASWLVLRCRRRPAEGDAADGKQDGKPQTGLAHRAVASMHAAVLAGVESLAFWFDMLWLAQAWASADARQLPYTACISLVYLAGCLSYAAVSLPLIFPLAYHNPRLDVDLIKENPLLWSILIVSSWAASPSILTLLPWTQRRYAGLPTEGAMVTTFRLRTAVHTMLILLKTAFVLSLSASEDLVLFTLAFNLLAFARALIQRALVYSALTAAKTRWKRVQIFLSYRVETDSELVEALYARLRGHGLRVWFDKKELQTGQKWEAGFVDGLFDSQIFVPVLSAAGLEHFAKLRADTDKCDNVLLEQSMALEQKERGAIKAIVPVLVGSVAEEERKITNGEKRKRTIAAGEHAHFFNDDGGLPVCRDVLVKAVDEKLHEHLTRRLKRSGREQGPAAAMRLLEKNRTPRRILEQLCQHQGVFIFGPRDASLDMAAKKILETARLVVNADEDDEANKGKGKGGNKGMSRDNLLSARSWSFLSARSWSGLSRRSRVGSVPSESDDARMLEDGGHIGVVDVAAYFVSGMRKEELDDARDGDGLMINPILVEQAKWKREEAAQRKRNNARAMQGTGKGKLARLNLNLDPAENELSERQKAGKSVDAYLRQYEGVEPAEPPPELQMSRASVGGDNRKLFAGLSSKLRARQEEEESHRRKVERGMANISKARTLLAGRMLLPGGRRRSFFARGAPAAGSPGKYLSSVDAAGSSAEAAAPNEAANTAYV